MFVDLCFEYMYLFILVRLILLLFLMNKLEFIWKFIL